MAQSRRSEAPTLRRVLVALVVALAATVAACNGDEPAEDPVDKGDTPAADLPDWIVEVHPAPGAEVTAIPAVQVDHEEVDPTREVRLSINDVDVTAYAAETSPGLIEYDPEAELDPDIAAEAPAPVELEPGEHVAVVELYEVEPDKFKETGDPDYEVVEQLDEFEWTFTIQ